MIVKPRPIINQAFAKDVVEGLSQFPKSLPSKYFYDAKGDALFQAIMDAPEYYLTNCEFDILTQQAEALRQAFGDGFDLIELGAGDGTKTKVLLKHFLHKQTDFNYLPVDISQHVLDELGTDLTARWPNLNFDAIQGDWFEVLENLDQYSQRKRVLLFMGANIGNLRAEEATQFLQKIQSCLSKGDLILIGFDLKKDPATILAAYNDIEGITRKFNLNYLERINRELGGNFDLNQFEHWPTYNPITGDTRSFLVSKQEQEVYLKYLNQTIHFDAWEAIDMELSKKYSITDIEQLALQTGFDVVDHFTDGAGLFVDTLWQK